MNDWKTEKLTKIYLDGVRGAIPFANEQIELIVKIIRFFQPNIKSFLDLGCGDGILGRTIFKNWPHSEGIYLDFSEPMVKEAKTNCKEFQNSAIFVLQDFGHKGWYDSISKYLPVDLVISGFAIHHQSNINKKRIYKEIFNLILKPGGLFLNMEHVASQSKEIENIFNEIFIDCLVDHNRKSNSNKSRETIAQGYYNRDDKKLNILASVEDQCNWLKKIGFVNVDCYFKIFELALFGGVKPN